MKLFGFIRNSIVSFYSKIIYSYSQTTNKDDSESNRAMMNDIAFIHNRPGLENALLFRVIAKCITANISGVKRITFFRKIIAADLSLSMLRNKLSRLQN